MSRSRTPALDIVGCGTALVTPFRDGEVDVAALATLVEAQIEAGVDFLVQPGQESQLSGHTPKGAPKYKTKRWLDVSNTGSTDAEHVTFEAIHDGYMILLGSKEPTTIHKGQNRRLPVQYAAGGSDGARLRIRWTEDGEDKERVFHVG